MDSLRKTESRIMVCGQFIYPVNDDCQLILRGEQVEHEPLPEQAATRVSHSLEIFLVSPGYRHIAAPNLAEVLRTDITRTQPRRCGDGRPVLR